MEIAFDVARSLAPTSDPDPNRDIVRIADPPDLHAAVRMKGSGFFDVADPTQPMGDITLVRTIIDDEEQFLLQTRLAYKDRLLGVILVPGRSGVLLTDLASIPQVFNWLVPKTGKLLPAALIHDGLTPPPDDTYVGPKIVQSDADRVLRDAMRDLGTGWIQRWLVWTAVAMATEFEAGIKNNAWRTPTGMLIVVRMVAFVGTILLLGTMATLDVLGFAELLPWMGDRSVEYEVLTGALFAVLVPFVLSLIFLRRKLVRAGMILGIAMAVFLHATLILLALLLLYNALESAINAAIKRGPWSAAAKWMCGLVALLVGLPLLVKLALWIPHGLIGSVRISGARTTADTIATAGHWLWTLPGWLYLLAIALCLLCFTRLPLSGQPE